LPRSMRMYQSRSSSAMPAFCASALDMRLNTREPRTAARTADAPRLSSELNSRSSVPAEGLRVW
jgi:hypothetical protein